MLSYQRLAAAGGLVTGPGGVPLGVYPENMSAYLSGMGAEQPAFYANPVSCLSFFIIKNCFKRLNLNSSYVGASIL